MRILIGIGVFGIILVSGFYAFNAYVYEEKQSELTQLNNGEYFGYIYAVTDNGTAIDFSEGDSDTGQRAERVRIALASDVRILLLTGKTGRDAFIELSPQDFGKRLRGLEERWYKAFYRLIYTDGMVQSIIELDLETPAEFGPRERNSAPAP